MLGITVTKDGKKFIKKPVSFLVAANSDYDDEPEEAPDSTGVAVADESLYNMLLDLRKKIAQKRGHTK